LRDSVKKEGLFNISSGTQCISMGLSELFAGLQKTWVTDGIIDNFIPQLYRQDVRSYNNELTNRFKLCAVK
jgi:uncharacterized lipoprotein YddW (UPF0748 family)